MKQKSTNLKTSFKTLALGSILIALPLTIMWLLANWISTTGVSWLAIPFRIVQWCLVAMLFGFIVYMIYSIFKSLRTGKDIFD
jgi:hypothetical protein